MMDGNLVMPRPPDDLTLGKGYIASEWAPEDWGAALKANLIVEFFFRILPLKI
jgi:hypothetical protein